MPSDREQGLDSELTRASAELACTRERLVVSMDELGREVTRSLDWREWVRRKPGMALCLAFGLGIFLGRRD